MICHTVKETVAVSPTSIAVNESDSFTLHCVATGHPFPIIGWIAGTELVIESDKYVLNEYQSNAYTVTSTLTVLDSQPDNTKEYRCRAESEGFQVESSFVSVIRKLIMIKPYIFTMLTLSIIVST